MRQLSLFEEPYRVSPKRNESTERPTDEYPYLIYIATEKGNCTGIIYECKSIEQARDFCSREDTKGQYMGVEWAHFFTQKSRFMDDEVDIYEHFNKGRKNHDRQSDTRFDHLLEQYGLRKI